MKEEHGAIKNLIESILEKMGIEAIVEFTEEIDIPVFSIKTNEAGILIGDGGRNLLSFYHIIKKITQKQFKEKDVPQFSLDVNGYYAKKLNGLKEVAKMGAQRALFFKKEVILEPMNAFERRVVHTSLQEYPDIKTESV